VNLFSICSQASISEQWTAFWMSRCHENTD
jgi:hypothetical protein